MPSYERISKTYSLLDVIYFRNTPGNPRKKIMELIPDEDSKVLDLCCGTMSNSIELASKKQKLQVTGLDLSKEMLAIATDKINELQLTNVNTVLGDATYTRFPDGHFDYVILGLVLHETTEELNRKILKEVHRILKPVGKLIILEWEPPTKIRQKIWFSLIRLSEPKPFKTFIKLDKKEYFNSHHFEVEKMFSTDYSCVIQCNNSPREK